MLSKSIKSAGISACCAVLLLSACSSDDDATPDASKSSQLSPTANQVPVVGQSAIGSVFTASENNLTVYTLTSGEPGVLSCDAACEAIWPPVLTDVTDKGSSTNTNHQCR